MVEQTNHPEFLSYLAKSAFGARTAARKLHAYGPGDFTETFRLELNRAPWRVIAKLFKAEDRLKGCSFELEAETLRYMRSLDAFPVPEVYYHHTGSARYPRDAILLEYVDGHPVTEVYDRTTSDGRRELVENVTQALVRLHGVTNAAGFGPLRGPFRSSWAKVYLPRLDRAYRRLDRSVEIPEMVEAADASYDLREEILTRPDARASLLHGDLFWTNILVDPGSRQVNGLIDPIIDPMWPMPQWGDPEYEVATLLFMDMPIGVDLVACHERHQPLDDGFGLRRRFYNLWLVLDIWRTIGYHNKETDRRVASALLAEMADAGLM